MKSVSEHWHRYLETAVLGRIQALLTQLVFEHSLRIRMKGETESRQSDPQDLASSQISSVIEVELGAKSSRVNSNHENAQTEQEQGETQSSSTTTALARDVESTANKKGKTRAGPADTVGKTTNDTKNLVGTINNLVTSDLDAIADGTNFLTFGKYVSDMGVHDLTRNVQYSSRPCKLSCQ